MNRLNEHLGWGLLLVGLLIAIGLDPWSLSERNPDVLVGSTRMKVRHLQAVVLAMGFLQLAVVLLLREEAFSSLRRAVGRTLAVGTLVYVAGYAGLAFRREYAWLIPIGAGINLLGFALLNWSAWRASVSAEVRVVLAVFLFGMFIDVASGLFAINPEHFLLTRIGPEDGVRQRMLRLARVAATALSVLVLLFRDLMCAARVATSTARWGRASVLIGAAGMPTILVAACFIHLNIKYLLPIPALAMTAGVVAGLILAYRNAHPLEVWGWLLVMLSMNVGLLVGMYAFDGPLPTPEFVGAYNDYVRRLMRLGHAYAIVFGLLAIVLSRRGVSALASAALIAGSVVTLMGIALVALFPMPALLAAGPGVLALALLIGLMSRDISPAVGPETLTALQEHQGKQS